MDMVIETSYKGPGSLFHNLEPGERIIHYTSPSMLMGLLSDDICNELCPEYVEYDRPRVAPFEWWVMDHGSKPVDPIPVS